MKDSDLTLLHPKANETGAGFTRNTDGGLEESNVGYIVGASFFTTENNVKNESEIITENGLILRPDRMVINNQRVTLIDYKTGKKAQKYYEQLYTYADALKTMGYLVENKILVYIDKKITPEFIN